MKALRAASSRKTAHSNSSPARVQDHGSGCASGAGFRGSDLAPLDRGRRVQRCWENQVAEGSEER
eukprot:2221639-Pleurochrysis_carterae.AAC.1